MFGYPHPTIPQEQLRLYWGARAILNAGYSKLGSWNRKTRLFDQVAIPQGLDIIYDRQSYKGVNEPDEKEFEMWLNTIAIPKVKEWAETVRPNSREIFTFNSDHYQIMASPNASHGYVYIGAWEFIKIEEVKKDEAV